MIAADAVLSVTFADVSVPVSSSATKCVVSRVAAATSDLVVAVAPIRGLAPAPASGQIYDMSPAHAAAHRVSALQPDDV